MPDPILIRLYLCNLAGEYLEETDGGWRFSTERGRAAIFEMAADEVADQLEEARRECGVRWMAVPVNPLDLGEACDTCSTIGSPLETYFDGTRYFCARCVGAGLARRSI